MRSGATAPRKIGLSADWCVTAAAEAPATAEAAASAAGCVLERMRSRPPLALTQPASFWAKESSSGASLSPSSAEMFLGVGVGVRVRV